VNASGKGIRLSIKYEANASGFSFQKTEPEKMEIHESSVGKKDRLTSSYSFQSKLFCNNGKKARKLRSVIYK
jgi:hypothetical protein